MMYPFMTLNDHTEIVHSEMHADGSVLVHIENQMRRCVLSMRTAGFRNTVGKMYMNSPTKM